MSSLYRLERTHTGLNFTLPCDPWHTPEIVCLCGSTKFLKEFEAAQMKLTFEDLAIVLTIGNTEFHKEHIFMPLSDFERHGKEAQLDRLHINKIDLADTVYIINKDGYIGETTARQLAHAKEKGKKIRFLEWDKAPHPWNDKNPPLPEMSRKN